MVNFIFVIQDLKVCFSMCNVKTFPIIQFVAFGYKKFVCCSVFIYMEPLWNSQKVPWMMILMKSFYS
jgi:hypothetical protein